MTGSGIPLVKDGSPAGSRPPDLNRMSTPLCDVAAATPVTPEPPMPAISQNQIHVGAPPIRWSGWALGIAVSAGVWAGILHLVGLL